MLTSIAKDTISDLRWRLGRKTFNRNRNETVDRLAENGVAVLESQIPEELCSILREEIDRALTSSAVKVWRDDVDADKRVYGFESVCPFVLKHLNVWSLASLGSSYLGCQLKSVFAVGARLDARTGNQGSGAGWHRDSPFSHQFKVIVYLSDVRMDNGPFEYFIGSHTSKSKRKLQAPMSRRTMRFNCKDVESLHGRSTLTGREGTMIAADTRGIHRGAPITAGFRYAITLYFWPRKPPKKFGVYLQDSYYEL